jgi:hypothetical protein
LDDVLCLQLHHSLLLFIHHLLFCFALDDRHAGRQGVGQSYRRYAERWPYEVTQLTKDVSKGRLVPSKGLTAFQVTEMFSNFGFSPEIYMRMHNGELFEKLLYMYVESGLPVVAALSEHSHAITIIGHISDFSMKPLSTPVSSDVYLKGLIANDDNFMPYQAIRKSDPIAATGYWSRFKVEEFDTFIVPLYEKVHLSAEHVVVLSKEISSKEDVSKVFASLEQKTAQAFADFAKSKQKVLEMAHLKYLD